MDNYECWDDLTDEQKEFAMDFIAYTAFDKEGTEIKPNILRILLYAFKRFMNTMPLIVKYALFAIIIAVDALRSFLHPTASILGTTPIVVMCSIIGIPFFIVNVMDLNRKYGANIFMYTRGIPTAISGICMIAFGFFGNVIFLDVFKNMWKTPAPQPVLTYYGFVFVAFLVSYISVRSCFKIYNISFRELWTTTILLTFMSFWVGVVACWVVALLIIIVALFFFFSLLSIPSGGGKGVILDSWPQDWGR